MKTEQQLLADILEAEAYQAKLKGILKDWERKETECRADLLKLLQNDGVKKQDLHTSDGRTFSVSVGKRGGGLWHTDDLDAIPKQFIREKVERSVDKAKLTQHLKENVHKPNWAGLKEPEDTLVIKLKE